MQNDEIIIPQSEKKEPELSEDISSDKNPTATEQVNGNTTEQCEEQAGTDLSAKARRISMFARLSNHFRNLHVPSKFEWKGT